MSTLSCTINQPYFYFSENAKLLKGVMVMAGDPEEDESRHRLSAYCVLGSVLGVPPSWHPLLLPAALCVNIIASVTRRKQVHLNVK